jgi:hypothetical protein
MAFAFALPAIGSAVLPAVGSVVGGIGSLASAVPVVGGSLGSLLGTGGGGGLAGALTGLGSGSGLGASLGTLGTGIKGMLPAFGTHSSGHLMGGLSDAFGGIGKAAGGLYAGADKLAGGLLPNLGIGGTITPSQGYLGGLFGPAASSQPVGYGTVLAPPEGGFGSGLMPGNDGGFFGMGKGKMPALMNLFGVLGDTLGSGGGGRAGVSGGQVTPYQVNVQPNRAGGNLNFGVPLTGQPAGYMPNQMNQAPRYSDQISEDQNKVALELLNAEADPTSPQAKSLANMYGNASSMLS